VRLERLGIAAVPVATREFMTAARAQAGALGRADLDAVYVEHPIQDQTPQEIAAKAEAVIGEIVARLTIGAACGSELAPSETAGK
jgi:hypothetical protein